METKDKLKHWFKENGQALLAPVLLILVFGAVIYTLRD